MPFDYTNYAGVTSPAAKDTGESASGMTGGFMSLIMPLLLGVMGKYFNDEQAKDVITPKQGIDSAQSRYDDMSNRLDQQLSGQTNNPMVQDARSKLTDRANKTYSPIGQTSYVQPPQRFNPYQQQGYGQSDPAMMQALMGYAMGGQNPVTQFGNQTLMNSMANRFGTRDMNGTLNPLQKPKGY